MFLVQHTSQLVLNVHSLSIAIVPLLSQVILCSVVLFQPVQWPPIDMCVLVQHTSQVVQNGVAKAAEAEAECSRLLGQLINAFAQSGATCNSCATATTVCYKRILCCSSKCCVQLLCHSLSCYSVVAWSTRLLSPPPFFVSPCPFQILLAAVIYSLFYLVSCSSCTKQSPLYKRTLWCLGSHQSFACSCRRASSMWLRQYVACTVLQHCFRALVLHIAFAIRERLMCCHCRMCSGDKCGVLWHAVAMWH